LQRGQTTLLNQRMSQAAQPDFWLLIFFVIECERVSGFFFFFGNTAENWHLFKSLCGSPSDPRHKH